MPGASLALGRAVPAGRYGGLHLGVLGDSIWARCGPYVNIRQRIRSGAEGNGVWSAGCPRGTLPTSPAPLVRLSAVWWSVRGRWEPGRSPLVAQRTPELHSIAVGELVDRSHVLAVLARLLQELLAIGVSVGHVLDSRLCHRLTVSRGWDGVPVVRWVLLTLCRGLSGGRPGRC